MTAQLRHCARAAAELGAGHPEILAQEIVHRQIVAHVHRADGAAVDRDGSVSSRERSLEHGLASPAGTGSGGRWHRRWRSAAPARRESSRLPPCLSAARPASAAAAPRSRDRAAAGPIPRATRYCPRFHCPLPGRPRKGGSDLEQRVADAHREAALRLPKHDFRHQRLAAFEHAVGLGDAQRAGRALDLDADQRAAHRRVDGADPVVVGGRKFHARRDRCARICRRPCARPAHRYRPGPLFAGDREGRARPCPAREGVRHRPGHEIARMRALAASAGNASGAKARHDELPILPARLRPFLGASDRSARCPTVRAQPATIRSGR